MGYAVNNHLQIRATYFSLENDDFSSVDSKGFDAMVYGGVGLSERRVKGYITFKGVIERFGKESRKGKKLMVRGVDSKLAEQFKTMNMSKLISNQKLDDVVLFDGRTINIKQDVDSLHLYNNKIDYLELRSGEIVDRLDIHQLQINLSGRVQRLIGVDGGG